MKLSRFRSTALYFVMIAACGKLSAQVAAPTQAGIADGPMIQFDNREYNFVKAPAGEFVKHVYMVTNTGTDTLDITDVHPGCGCTTAGEWTRQLAPGQSGTIPIQFNSSHYSGNVTKTITVTSNAKNEPRATLILKGTVWKPIDVAPQTAVISVQSDATNAASTTVKIVNQTESELTLSEPTSTSKAFSAALKTVKPGKEFQLVVTVKPPFAPGNSPATISMKTSLTNVPTLTVTAIASVQQAVQVSPAQITLSPPVDRWVTNRVLIRGTGNTVLALEDAQCSDSQIDVKIIQLGAHGMYNLAVAIPPNYQIPPGEKVKVTVKSNHPKYPLITVPITQFARNRGMAGQYTIPPMVNRTATNGAAQPHP